MTKKRKNSQNSRKTRGLRIPRPLPEDRLSYNGPVVTQRERQNRELAEVVFQQLFAISCNAGGAAFPVFSNDPNSVNGSAMNGWTAEKALWDFYRCVAMDVEVFSTYCLVNTAASAPTSGSLLAFGVVDQHDTTALTSSTDAATYDSLQCLNSVFVMGKSFKFKWRMNGVDDAKFIDPKASSATGAVKLGLTGFLANAGNVCIVLVRQRIEFQGRSNT